MRQVTVSQTGGQPARVPLEYLGSGRANQEIVDWVRERLVDWHQAWVLEMTRRTADLLMADEARSICAAERAKGSKNSVSGRREPVWSTSLGDITLAVPRLRLGRYQPAFLDQRDSQLRAERAIASLIARACLTQITASTVDDLAGALGMVAITSSQTPGLAAKLNQLIDAFGSRPLDAEPYTYLWIEALAFERGLQVDEPTAVAWAMRASGRQEILGIRLLTGDDKPAWSEFIRGFLERGLSGVRLVTTGTRPGLTAAVAELFPGVSWQQSRASLVKAVVAAVPTAAQPLVAILVNSIFDQPSSAAARAQHANVIDQLRERFPEAAAKLTKAGPDMLAFTSFPKADWPRIWSNRPPGELDDRDRLTISHQQRNFFIVTLDPPRQVNGAGSAAEDRETRSEIPAPPPAAPMPTPSQHRVESALSRLSLLWQAVDRRLAGLARTVARQPEVSPAAAAAPAAIRVPAWVGAFLVVGVLAVTLAEHAANAFGFPRYELDEGTYMGSAWAILNGQITAYPYGYGHPPLGWIQIAIWTQLTGGFFTFGNALNSGRVLMTLYSVGSSWLVYLIASRLSGRRLIGLFALILFSFSPLSLLYQRQVYLDNIAVFWLLLSIFLIVAGKSRLSFIVGAGVSFGFAVLSKETVVILLPVMVFALWLNTSRYQRMFGLITFTYTVVGLGAGLVVLATLRGELLPYAWHLPWDNHPHLSLLDTLAVQVQRSQAQGSFKDAWYTWTQGDSVLIVASIVATVVNLIAGLWKRNHLFLALAAGTYWLFLARGGVVLPFYIIVLIPFAALNISMAASAILELVRGFARVELVATVLVAGVAAGVMASDFNHSETIFTQQPTSAQTQAMVWIRNHVSPNAVVVVNSYLYLDLRQPGGEGVGSGAPYPQAQVYWNMAYDPELHDGLLQNNWDRIDYIVADSEMLHDITTAGGPMTLLQTALSHSVLRQEFRADDNERLKADANRKDVQIVISIFEVMHKQQPPSLVGS